MNISGCERPREFIDARGHTDFDGVVPCDGDGGTVVVHFWEIQRHHFIARNAHVFRESEEDRWGGVLNGHGLRNGVLVATGVARHIKNLHAVCAGADRPQSVHVDGPRDVSAIVRGFRTVGLPEHIALQGGVVEFRKNGGGLRIANGDDLGGLRHVPTFVCHDEGADQVVVVLTPLVDRVDLDFHDKVRAVVSGNGHSEVG